MHTDCGTKQSLWRQPNTDYFKSSCVCVCVCVTVIGFVGESDVVQILSIRCAVLFVALFGFPAVFTNSIYEPRPDWDSHSILRYILPLISHHSSLLNSVFKKKKIHGQSYRSVCFARITISYLNHAFNPPFPSSPSLSLSVSFSVLEDRYFCCLLGCLFSLPWSRPSLCSLWRSME